MVPFVNLVDPNRKMVWSLARRLMGPSLEVDGACRLEAVRSPNREASRAPAGKLVGPQPESLYGSWRKAGGFQQEAARI